MENETINQARHTTRVFKQAAAFALEGPKPDPRLAGRQLLRYQVGRQHLQDLGASTAEAFSNRTEAIDQ
jgi:hypothetical protein